VPLAKHNRYGQLNLSDDAGAIVQIRPGFYEVPMATRKVAGKTIPWSGGGYCLLMPYRVFKRGLEQILNDQQAYVFYLHPWEIDPDQNRAAGLTAGHRFCHYVNLNRTEAKWTRLLDDFQWTSVWDMLQGTAHVSETLD
jgi:hypothetical protein